MIQQKQRPKASFKLVRTVLSFAKFGLFFVAITGVFLYTHAGTPRHVKAATSDTINFQARLLTSSGAIVPDGTYNVEFKLYTASTPDVGETPIQGSCTTNPGAVADEDCLWVETRTGTDKVTVKSGYLTVHLGSLPASPFPSTIPWDQNIYLSMNIGGTGTPVWDGEMSPRLKLTAVPFAMAAGQLAKLTGANTSTLKFDTQTTANSILLPNAGGTLAIATGGSLTNNGVLYGNGTTSIQATAAGTTGQCLVATTSSAPSWGLCAGTGSGVTLQAGYDNSTVNPEIKLNSTRGAVNIQDADSSLGSAVDLFAVNASNASGLGSTLFNVQGSGNVGIGVASPTRRLQIGTLTSASTATPETLSLGGTFSSSAGANAKLRVYDDNTNYFGFGASASQLDYIVSVNTSDHVFYGASTEILRVRGNGNVGVGTTGGAAVLNKLHVSTTTSADGISVDGTTNPALNLRNTGVIKAYLGLATSANSWATGTLANDLVFRTDDTTNGNIHFMTQQSGTVIAQTITRTGNVGVGIVVPTARLHVVGANQATAATAALDALRVTGGAGGIATGGAGGAGGALFLTGGNGGASSNAFNSGNGGAINITGGTTGSAGGTGIRGTGGVVNITGGSGNGGGSSDGGTGGNVIVKGGVGGDSNNASVNGGTGGNITIQGGTAGFGNTGATGGNGGVLSLQGGDGAGAGNGASSGGNVYVVGGGGVIGAGTVGNVKLGVTSAGVARGNIVIGAADTAGQLLVLDTKNDTTANDPTGTAGAMYYNSFTDRFRCFQGIAWKDCDVTTSGVFLAKDQVDTSTASVSLNNWLYTFTNSSLLASGVLKLDNGANATNSTLVVTGGANPTSNQALIFASNTNASPTGNLLDLQSGSSPTSKFSVSASGLVTLAGGQTVDITTPNATIGTTLTLKPGTTSGSSNNGRALVLTGGDASGTTSVIAGAVTITGGSATGITGTRTGGNVTIDAGTGATSNGSILLGGTNDSAILLGATSGTQTLTFGRSTAGQTLNIGNATVANGNTQTINIGTSASGTGKNVITLGSSSGASSLNLLSGVNNSGNITVGTSDTNATLFVVDTKTDAEGVLAGTPGAMYYNSSLGKFRCYEGASWANCVASASGVTGSGTTNRVAYWNGGSSLTSSDNFFFDGTNVGIGTTSVSAKLHVVGTNQSTSATNAVNVLTVTGGKGGNAVASGASGGNGAVLSLTSGQGGDSATASTGGNGGEISVITGDGGIGTAGMTRGNSGALKLQTGDGGGGNGGSLGHAGQVTIQAGNGGGSGSTTTNTMGNGGSVSIISGNGGTAVGTAGIAGDAGVITLQGGNAGNTGGTGKVGGSISLTGGTGTLDSSSTGTKTGGAINLTGGTAGHNASGGNVVLNGGLSGTGGSTTTGDVLLQSSTAGNVILGGVSPSVAQLLVLDSTTVNPAAVTAGAMYYNSSTGKFICGEASSWINCVSNPSTLTGTGVANRVAFWTTTSNLSNSNQFFFDGTNVGIGTTSVSAKLHVVGANQSTATLAANDSFVVSGGAGGAADLTAVGGTGADISLLSGTGGAPSSSFAGGTGGELTLQAGSGGTGNTAGESGGAGGAFSIVGGSGGGGHTSSTGNGGSISITAGSSGNSSFGATKGNAGSLTLRGGTVGGGSNRGGNGGSISLLASNGGAADASGFTAGAGGALTLTAGNAGDATSGATGANGGQVTISAGNGGGGSGTTSGGDIYLHGGFAGSGGTNGDILLAITTGGSQVGNVGIGDLTPDAMLDVAGSFQFDGSGVFGDASGDSLTINASTVSIPNNLNFDSNTLFIDAANNRIGVVTATTNEAVTVAGRLSLQETTSPSLTANYGKIFVKSSDSKLYFMNDSGTEFDLTAAAGAAPWNTTASTVHLGTETNLVRIGSGSNTAKLHVFGNAGTGDGGAATSAMTILGGNGAAGSTNPGGSGGGSSITGGVGGAGGTTTAGGVGGALTITSGAGGAHSTAGQTAGAAGSISITGGTGGSNSSGVSGTGGAGGSITIQSGTGGTGTTANGANGSVNLQVTSGNVGIGTASPANKLSVNSITTADSLAQLAIGTGATTNKGLLIQGVTSQTADLMQIQNSLGTRMMVVTATGDVGIGSVTPGARLKVYKDSTAGSGDTLIMDVQGVQTVANTGAYVGIRGYPSYSATTGNTLATLMGAQGVPVNNSTGTITNNIGVQGAPINNSTGTITSNVAFWAVSQNNSTGTISNNFGVYVQNPVNSGTITNNWGIFVDDQINGTITNKYAIVTGFSAGNVGIGITAPTQARLVVQGTTSSSSAASLEVMNSSGTSAFYVRNDGVVGVKTNTPFANVALTVKGDSAVGSGDQYGLFVYGNQSVANAQDYRGIWSQPEYTAASGTLGQIVGVMGRPRNNSPGTITTAYGTMGIPDNVNGGTITTSYGLYGRVDNVKTGGSGTNTIGTAYGAFIATPLNNGTITNKYGLVIESGAGNVGVGNISPGVKLHVQDTIDGNIFRLQDSDGTCDYNPESGAVTVSCSSDARLKSDITDTGDALSYLGPLNIRDYTVNASGDRLTGVIAQELLQTHPELVSMGEDGYYRVSEISSWKLVKAIQQLDSTLTDIDGRVSILETQSSSSTFNELNVSGAANINNLNVTGIATINNLTVTDTATVATLKVTGTASFAGDIRLEGSVNTRQAITKKFKASGPITAGQVVILDATQNGYVTTTTSLADTKIIGVAVQTVTGAGDEIEVAIGGSIQVQFETTTSVLPGDLITTGTSAGKASNSATAPANGSVLGKATSTKDANNLAWILILLN